MIVSDAQPAAHLPVISSKDLSGRVLTLPADLPGERTLVLIAFQREQQANIDTWTRGLALEHSELPWLELPVIDDPGAFARWFINGGMRRGIKDHALWQHVVTLYTNKAALKQGLNLSSEKDVYALVLDRQGRVLEHVAGDFSPDGAARLRAALR